MNLRYENLIKIFGMVISYYYYFLSIYRQQKVLYLFGPIAIRFIDTVAIKYYTKAYLNRLTPIQSQFFKLLLVLLLVSFC